MKIRLPRFGLVLSFVLLAGGVSTACAQASAVKPAEAVPSGPEPGFSDTALGRLLYRLRPQDVPNFVRAYEPTEIGATWDEGDQRFMDFKFSAMFPLWASRDAFYPPIMEPAAADAAAPRPGVYRLRDLDYGKWTLFFTGTIRSAQYIKTRPSSPVVGKRFNPQLLVRFWALDSNRNATSVDKYFDVIPWGHESNGQSITKYPQYLEQWEIYRKLEGQPETDAARDNAELGARDSISRGWDYVGLEWGWSWRPQPAPGDPDRKISRKLRVKVRHFLPWGPAQGTAENYNDWEGDGDRFRRRHYDGLMLQYTSLGNPIAKYWEFFTGRYTVTFTTGLSQPLQHSTVELDVSAKIGALPLSIWARYGYNSDLVDYYRLNTSGGIRVSIWEY